MSQLKELEQLLAQGIITRREFIARVSALGLTAAMSPMLLASPARAWPAGRPPTPSIRPPSPI
jgi:hypothetical protein